MCGLAGVLKADVTGLHDMRAIVQRMTDSLLLRGPDADGIWCEEGVALGHRRLAIIDLSAAGAQPMLSDGGRFVIAFNGEIYNHIDLRSQLEASGAAPNWLGHSDTETLLAGIAFWGLDETLKRTKGMFALALWDRANRSLSLARDRMGEKPLYWGWAGSDLIFGSELKALRAHPACPRQICRKALSQYLRFMYVPAPRSIYAGLFKLEPGSILTVEGSPPACPPEEPIRPAGRYESISIRRYWDLNAEIEVGASSPIEDDAEAVGMLDEVLSSAVQRQMMSDVPLGAFLSGGVDSSTIVALMQANQERAVDTFTIGFEATAFDEAPYAAGVARHLGTNHSELRVTDAIARDVIPELSLLYDEPFADSSQIPTYLVCRAARQHVKVALSGDGADELFGGYNRYIHGPALWKRISVAPQLVRRISGKAAQSIPERTWDMFGQVYNRLRPGTAGISGLGTKVHRLGERLRLTDNLDDLHRNLASAWIEPEAVMVDHISEPVSQLDDQLPEFGAADPAMRMMLQDMRSYLPDDILCKVDRAAMGVSLETRAPFLDPDVISLSARLPINMKIRGSQGKWALRQVLHQHVPRELIERPKVGFSVPIGAWLRGPLRDWAEGLLSRERLTNDGFFKPEIIRVIWAEHLSGRRDWSMRLWAILMFQAWWAEWK